jgi:hypothetical protein
VLNYIERTETDVQTGLTATEAWIVALRCLEWGQICIPCQLPGVNPAAVARVLSIAAQNQAANMEVTNELRRDAVKAHVAVWLPGLMMRQRKSLHSPNTVQWRMVCALNEEAITAGLAEPTLVDPEAVAIIDAALKLGATYGPIEYRAEAQDVLDNGLHILHGAVTANQ